MSPTYINCMGFGAQLLYLTESVCELNFILVTQYVCLFMVYLTTLSTARNIYVCKPTASNVR